MPRPNPLRTIQSEETLARRIAYERQRLDMSYAGLAKRMTDAGCAIDQSAVYKIEKGSPRRRISVDELVAMSEVFKVALPDLLLPPELAIDARTHELVENFRQARAAQTAATSKLIEHIGRHVDRVRPDMADLGFTPAERKAFMLQALEELRTHVARATEGMTVEEQWAAMDPETGSNTRKEKARGKSRKKA